MCFYVVLCLLSFPLQAQHTDAWDEIKKQKKGTVTILHYDTYPSVYQDDDGNVNGIEYDIFMAFIDFLKQEYNFQVTPRFREAKSFPDLYHSVKNGRDGLFGICSFSITPKRQTEVNFYANLLP